MPEIKSIFKSFFSLPNRLFSGISLFSLVKESHLDRTVVVQYGCRIYNSSIQRYSYVNNGCYIIDCSVGSFCSIANNVMIGGGQHPTNFVSTSPIFYTPSNVFKICFNKAEFEEYQKTLIGNDVWIGSYSFIKGGVTIGDGAIIAAHAVVTKDVEPYSIVGGNPAKLIRKRFDDATIDYLIKSKWWSLDNDALKEKASRFHQVHEFVKFEKSENPQG